jgi:hypothetical protein
VPPLICDRIICASCIAPCEPLFRLNVSCSIAPSMSSTIEPGRGARASSSGATAEPPDMRSACVGELLRRRAALQLAAHDDRRGGLGHVHPRAHQVVVRRQPPDRPRNLRHPERLPHRPVDRDVQHPALADQLRWDLRAAPPRAAPGLHVLLGLRSPELLVVADDVRSG